jgi:hypothetical protein
MAEQDFGTCINAGHYFFAINEQIRHDSARAGNNMVDSLSMEYAITRQKGKRKKYSNVLTVQGKHGANIDRKRYQIIALK